MAITQPSAAPALGLVLLACVACSGEGTPSGAAPGMGGASTAAAGGSGGGAGMGSGGAPDGGATNLGVSLGGAAAALGGTGGAADGSGGAAGASSSLGGAASEAAGGTSSTGGGAGTSGGMAGASGAGGSMAGSGGSQDSGPTCAQIEAEFSSSFEDEVTCSPGGGNQCEDGIEVPGCACRLFIEPKDPFSIEYLTNLYIDWLDADCEGATCPGVCSGNTRGACGSNGRCTAVP